MGLSVDFLNICKYSYLFTCLVVCLVECCVVDSELEHGLVKIVTIQVFDHLKTVLTLTKSFTVTNSCAENFKKGKNN